VLVLGKENVGIKAIEPIGHYAVRLVFDDGTTPACTPGNTSMNWERPIRPSGPNLWHAVRALRAASGMGIFAIPKKKGRVISPANLHKTPLVAPFGHNRADFCANRWRNASIFG